jgi:S1-C subfamily serine protease
MTPMLDYSERVRKAKPAVVKVLDTNNSREGSGFLIDKLGIIITAKHVISDAASTRVQFYDGVEKRCRKVLHADTTYDLAILKIEAVIYPALSMGDHENIEEGNEVYFCGYPLLS